MCRDWCRQVIGRAIALAHAKKGTNVVIAARTVADLAAVKEACPNPDLVTIVVADLSVPGGIDELASKVLSQGGCDVLVNNAGAWGRGQRS